MPSFALNQEIMNLEEQQKNGDNTVAARLKVCYAQRTAESAAATVVEQKKAASAAAQEMKEQKKMRGDGGGCTVLRASAIKPKMRWRWGSWSRVYFV